MDLSPAIWKKSSHSHSNGCVEVAVVGGTERKIALRDSKNQRGAILLFNPTEWAAFLAGVRDGEFDLEL
jgi:hypothetical protein